MLINILAFLLLIGPIILVHELGHLIAAKATDVKATRFSIGFGPPILRWHMGETEYCLAPIPLGGYVMMLGQHPHEEIPDAEADRALSNKPLWVRYLVLAAGPLANLILPLILLFFTFLGVTHQSPPIIGTVIDDSAAAAAELEPGDRVVAIDGTDIRSWNEMVDVVSAKPERELLLQIERDGKRFDRYATPRRTFRRNALGDPEPRGLLGITPYFYDPQIGIVERSSPAYEEGLRTGDIVTSINGEPVTTLEELERQLQAKSESLIRLTYLRPVEVRGPLGTYVYYRSNHAQLLPRKESGLETGMLPASTFLRGVQPGSPAERAGLRAGDRILEINAHPVTRWETISAALDKAQLERVELLVQSLDSPPRKVTVEQELREYRTVERAKIGVLWFGALPYRATHIPDPEPIRGRFNFAVWSAWHTNAEGFVNIFMALRQMFTFQRSMDDLSSVVGMYQVAGIAWKQGPGRFMFLIVSLSISIGLINLLPIPVLDGGHLLFFTIEAVRRKPLGQRSREIASAIGLLVILLLFLIALRNDIVRWFFE